MFYIFFGYICSMNSDINSNQPEHPASFLGALARAYLSRYEEMSDICFVFPNKRSGSFFLKHLSENLGDRTLLAPEIMDIAEFMARVSKLQEAPRIDMLFRLYNVYCGLLGKKPGFNTERDLLDFDRFASWGEVLLGDFSEAEQYCADAEKLFGNVRDYRSIASNFLTERQLDVIERYFGYRPVPEDAEAFWKSVYDADMSRLKEKFVELWKLMPELFEGLVSNLEADGLALPGTIFRSAAEKVEAEGKDALPWSHVVAAGFNMLSTAEARLFETMRGMRDEDGEPFAEFFWDAAGPVLGANSSSAGHAPSDLKRYRKEFPMPQWAVPFMAESDVKEMTPSIIISAAPSNVAQTKITAEAVESWLENIDPEEFEEARAAVVVPDENLLLPLLHSLPANLKNVNLTMGYSMRFTAAASFVYHLKRLQTRRRKTGDETGYFHEDIKLFLTHPLVHLVIGSAEANRISGEISKKHLRVVTPGWIAGYSAELAEMLRPIPKDASVSETVEYLESVLMTVDRALQKSGEGMPAVNSKMERTQVSTYIKALVTLANSVARHGITMGYAAVFHLVDRLVSGEKVSFEGKPLQGLQIMGLLETRAIDFDHVIVLSMNDKIMPRKGSRRSFIPDALRRSYGLPLSSKSEELYSYYFYRLLSRARDVRLIYDARAGEGMRSGGKSRYLMQLEMLYARDRIKKETYTFMLDAVSRSPQCVEKTPEVMEKLSYYLKEKEGRNLSASALMNYCSCQVKFYYKNVVGISDDAAPADYIDPVTQGQIVHGAMLELYFPEGKRNRYLKEGERILLTGADLQLMLQDKEKLHKTVTRAVNKEHFKLKGEDLDRSLTGTVAMVADRLVSQVEDMVRYDMSLAPIELIGGEISGNVRWKALDGPEVNMRYAFDRVDRVGGRVRMVDYKTGNPNVKAREFEDIFSGKYDSKYILQLLLYSHLFEERMKTEEGKEPGDISMLIYDVNNIGVDGAVMPKIGSTAIEGHKAVSEEFLESMQSMIEDIFDSSKPFMPADDEKNCSYCSLKALCGKL